MMTSSSGASPPAAQAASRSNRRLATGLHLILGAWLFASPWVLGFAAVAAWNAWVLGALLVLVSASVLARLALWQQHIALVLGAWVFAAPWLLGFNREWPAAGWDHWLTGVAIFLVAAWAVPAMPIPASAAREAINNTMRRR